MRSETVGEIADALERWERRTRCHPMAASIRANEVRLFDGSGAPFPVAHDRSIVEAIDDLDPATRRFAAGLTEREVRELRSISVLRPDWIYVRSALKKLGIIEEGN